VAIRTGGTHVGAGKRECRLGVVEDSTVPGPRAVAQRAVSWESRRGVIRTRGGLISGHVARGTILRGARELSV
jgi:hypothetical protein